MNDSQSVESEPRQPRRGTEQRRRQLLDVARDRFISEGYAGTSISAIVRQAGVAQGTFYVYFQSKQAVLADLRREVFRDYASALATTAALDLPPDARLVETVLAMVDAVLRNRELERVFRQAESAEDLERAALEGRARLATGAASILAQGVGEGRFVAEHPQQVAQIVVTLFDTVLYESIAYEQPAPLVETVEQSLLFVLRGLGSTPDRISELMASANVRGRPEWR